MHLRRNHVVVICTYRRRQRTIWACAYAYGNAYTYTYAFTNYALVQLTHKKMSLTGKLTHVRNKPTHKNIPSWKSSCFTELGEAARGRPPGPGLGGAQLKGHPDGKALMGRAIRHLFFKYIYKLYEIMNVVCPHVYQRARA